jgi:hypothetical protein
VTFTESLKAALPDRLVEIVALTAASHADNAYERVQHERLALTGILMIDEVRGLVAEHDARSIATLSPTEVEVAELTRLVVETRGHAGPTF